MDSRFTVHQRGVVYSSEGKVAAIRPASDSPPAAFKNVKPLATGGTIYPG
jgi:5-methylthioadenosine/S-adenosylhomocysteine deaminase